MELNSWEEMMEFSQQTVDPTPGIQLFLPLESTCASAQLHGPLSASQLVLLHREPPEGVGGREKGLLWACGLSPSTHSEKPLKSKTHRKSFVIIVKIT